MPRAPKGQSNTDVLNDQSLMDLIKKAIIEVDGQSEIDLSAMMGPARKILTAKRPGTVDGQKEYKDHYKYQDNYGDNSKMRSYLIGRINNLRKLVPVIPAVTRSSSSSRETKEAKQLRLLAYWTSNK